MNEILLLSALVLLPILAAGVCRVPDHRVLAVRRLGRYRRFREESIEEWLRQLEQLGGTRRPERFAPTCREPDRL